MNTGPDKISRTSNFRQRGGRMVQGLRLGVYGLELRVKG